MGSRHRSNGALPLKPKSPRVEMACAMAVARSDLRLRDLIPGWIRWRQRQAGEQLRQERGVPRQSLRSSLDGSALDQLGGEGEMIFRQSCKPRHLAKEKSPTKHASESMLCQRLGIKTEDSCNCLIQQFQSGGQSNNQALRVRTSQQTERKAPDKLLDDDSSSNEAPANRSQPSGGPKDCA